MKLTTVERERITDSVLKIQSVRASLEQVDGNKIPRREQIDACLHDVDLGLRAILGYVRQGDSNDPESGKT